MYNLHQGTHEGCPYEKVVVVVGLHPFVAADRRVGPENYHSRSAISVVLCVSVLSGDVAGWLSYGVSGPDGPGACEPLPGPAAELAAELAAEPVDFNESKRLEAPLINPFAQDPTLLPSWSFGAWLSFGDWGVVGSV